MYCRRRSQRSKKGRTEEEDWASSPTRNIQTKRQGVGGRARDRTSRETGPNAQHYPHCLRREMNMEK